ncbi:hypothetical protein [Streptomyces sp. NPDC087300]|uniref:hypothetical protein n=1 Tax=Streptomyces sp. NPDC087300 TaxID=3365780 RepID=UPI00380B122A
MSYEIFVCRFMGGEPAVLDRETAHEVLDPYVTARDGSFLQIKVILSRGADRELLPEGIRDGWEVAVVSTAEEIAHVIQAS